MEALTMLGMLRCDEESQFDRDGKESTVWLYQLAEDFDRATLLAMAERTGGATNTKIYDFNSAKRQWDFG
jgi:hypothetical protein